MAKKEDKKDLGITAEKDDFSEWFAQMMIKTELADYTDVSGCIVFRPSSYAIWEKIKDECDIRFKKLGIKNAYFPLLIPEKLLSKEKEHVEGFSPEVAWVTESGNTKLAERLAIRPTSEAIMYPSYSKWIRSWRDLPLKLNQWNNAVRWEFTHPVPFLRTREFLWNEGHSAFAEKDKAILEGEDIVGAYKEVCEKYLALYGMIGRKTEKEKFAGAVFSEKIHYIMPNGRAIEGPAFHHDGQNFAKAYNIKFINKNEKEDYVWQNTYAISTRMLGVIFAIHSDNKGLILPPMIAPNQIVIVPILFDDSKDKVLKKAREIASKLKDFGAFVDEREGYNPGFKFNDWEMKGIPLRFEIGPKDLQNNQVVSVRRDNGKKENIKISALDKKIPVLLDEIQKSLYLRSKKLFESKVENAGSLDALKKVIEGKKIGIVPICKKENCESAIKFKTKGAKALFISEEKLKKGAKCLICGDSADYLVYAGKSY
ncbi:proline--tRNA ligase [Candidatus Pacearchaeota archaeon]|nr:proline--tRNA ligase [Candidatus Pacearchaeota archaeon]